MPIPDCRQTGVIQTSYDIVKAHGWGPIAIGMKVETLSADLSVRNVVKAEAAAKAGKEGKGSDFIIVSPQNT